mmetsp:Transcript_124033/g.396919  ORF Transcript_124033/g.396919 Transcript_124033/m.396919 type:complete len:266 (-) Transcript_124033:729-1526(-)
MGIWTDSTTRRGVALDLSRLIRGPTSPATGACSRALLGRLAGRRRQWPQKRCWLRSWRRQGRRHRRCARRRSGQTSTPATSRKRSPRERWSCGFSAPKCRPGTSRWAGSEARCGRRSWPCSRPRAPWARSRRRWRQLLGIATRSLSGRRRTLLRRCRVSGGAWPRRSGSWRRRTRRSRAGARPSRSARDASQSSTASCRPCTGATRSTAPRPPSTGKSASVSSATAPSASGAGGCMPKSCRRSEMLLGKASALRRSGRLMPWMRK